MKVDVAIAGGGPAGWSAAIALRQRGIRCAVVTRDDGGGDKPGESLPPSAKPLLAQLGIDLEADGHLPCLGHRSVWGSDEPVEMPFVFSPYGHGWHLDRRRFEASLARGETAASLDELEYDFLIDAPGRSATLARERGATRMRDDTLTATVAYCDRHDCDSFTLVEAIEDGWWYSAPLPDGRAVAMFVSDEPRDFDAMLRKAAHTRARVTPSARRMHRDASSFRLDRVTGERWLAIGDAACALDPLSSHGIGAAMWSGIRAAEAIESGDFDAYGDAIDAMWNAYVTMRQEMYAAEARWPASSFWSAFRARYTAPP